MFTEADGSSPHPGARDTERRGGNHLGDVALAIIFRSSVHPVDLVNARDPERNALLIAPPPCAPRLARDGPIDGPIADAPRSEA